MKNSAKCEQEETVDDKKVNHYLSYIEDVR